MYKFLSKAVMVAMLSLVVAAVHAASREDPLRPPGHKVTESAQADETKPKTWQVNEILHSEGRRVAVVNNVAVKQGDLVDGAKVIDINSEQVTLKYKDETITSRLSMVPVKKLITNSAGR